MTGYYVDNPSNMPEISAVDYVILPNTGQIAGINSDYAIVFPLRKTFGEDLIDDNNQFIIKAEGYTDVTLEFEWLSR